MNCIKLVTLFLCINFGTAFASSQFVTDRNVFSGEAALNLTDGAPLSVSSAGKVTTGIANSETSSATSFTCGTTDNQVTGMTVTPVAGTYLALYSSDFNAANSGTIVTINFHVGGTAVSISQRKFMPFAGGTLTAGSQRAYGALHSIFAVNGSQAVQVFCQTSANSVTTANSQMDLVRLQ